MARVNLDELLEGRSRFVAFVRSRIDDPELAEDIVQDSLLRAVRSADTLADEARLVPWFFVLLRNAVTDAYRKRGRVPPPEDIDGQSDIEAPGTEEERVLCECFRALIPGLAPQYADLIVRLDLENQSTQSVLEQLQITPGALKVKHHRARQALKKRLDETCRTCAEHHCLDCTCGALRQV